MCKAARFLFLASLAALLPGLPAQAELVDILPAHNIGYDVDRLALVVGNSDYEFIVDLDNTLNDSNAIAYSLQSSGFKVIHAQNVTRRGMNDAIDRFLASVSPGSEALIYYAGHGVELNGENYLLPVDIRTLNPGQQRRLREESVGLNRLLQDLRARQARVNLILLDACRDNPFPKENTRSLGGNTGLGRIDPPNGTIVVYAAAAGEKALDKLGDDDQNPNGLFTRHLLELMEKPGLEIRPLVQELKERVYNEARTVSLRTQRPSYYDGLIGKFYLRPPAAAVTLKHPCEVLVDPHASKDAVLLNDYSASVPLCQSAIVLYPDKPLYRNLLSSAEEQWAAQKALTSSDSEASRAYLLSYGNGRYLRDVALHLSKLDLSVEPPKIQAARGDARATASPPAAEPVPVPATVPATISVPPSGPIPNQREIQFAIQSELNRLGCSAGRPDGVWGKRSAAALRNYMRHGDVRFASLDPSSEILDVLRRQDVRVCPLSCSSREILQNGKCIVKACPSGQRLSSKGNCYTPRKKSAKSCPSGQRLSSKGNCYTPRKQATQAAPASSGTTKKRRQRGVSGYNYKCEGAGPGLC